MDLFLFFSPHGILCLVSLFIKILHVRWETFLENTQRIKIVSETRKPPPAENLITVGYFSFLSHN